MPMPGDTLEAATLQQQTKHLCDKIAESAGSQTFPGLRALPAVLSTLEQFFAIMQSLEDLPAQKQPQPHDPELDKVANYGLELFQELESWCEQLKLKTERESLAALQMSLALWFSLRGAKLSALSGVVNSISILANLTDNTTYLSKIHDYVEQITDAVSDEIKADKDKSESSRPWRILNLNHGIIAARSHNPEIMEHVFEQLIHRLPEDASGFFAEGMQQMDIIGYPKHVRQVMERFYQLTNHPTLH